MSRSPDATTAMKYPRCIFLFVFALVSLSARAQVVLSLDVDERGVLLTNTMPGFDSFTITSNTSATAVQTTPTVRTYGAITVTLAGLGNPAYDDRIRTVPTNNPAAAPGFTQERLLRDVVFQGSSTNGDGLSVTLDGLTAAQFYKVTIWSYDNSSTGNRVSDWTANGSLVKSAYVFNGSTLPTTDAQYQFNFKIAADGTGRIVVQGRRNAATSSAGSVFINALQVEVTTPDPPTVTVQPVGSTLYAGDNAPALSVQVSGAAPFAYQWRLGGIEVVNATNASLVISNAQAGNAGGYACVITNAGGSVTSSVATLTVLPVVNIESGRVSYWPLDTVDSNPPDLTTPDTTASANHLYLTNMDGSNVGAGLRGNSLTFNGTNSMAVRIHTNSPGLPIYSYPAYTVALWVKGNFTNQFDRRVFSESSNTNNNALVNIGTDNAGTNSTVDIFIRNNDGSTPHNHRKSIRPAFDGNWHHIAWVDNNGAARLYVDGVLETNDFSYTRGTLTPNIASLGGILRTTPSSWFAGMIDDTVLYRRALSGSEVQTVMLCGPTATGTPPGVTQDPQSSTNNAGGSATFSASASGTAILTYQWFFGASPVSGATNSSLSLNNLGLGDAGGYSVTIANCFGSATSASATLTVNRLPIAGDNGASTTQNTPVGIFLAKLLINDSDADGDPISVVSVSAMSTNGGAVTLTSSNVIYAPVMGFAGTDRFSYTIGDGRGGTATAQVEVLVASGNLPSANKVSLELLAGGSVRVRFAGIPGHNYLVQRATDVEGPWTTAATLTAPLHGLIEYVDASPPQPTAFYRTTVP
jgi:hypothetical protein